MTTDTAAPAPHAFEADVAKLLHLMVHSVYSDKDVFLRELIANAADACEKLRYEGLSNSALLGDGATPAITVTLDPAPESGAKTLVVEDNGIGMSEAEMGEALGTIARSGTRAFMDKIADAEKAGDSQLIGQFGVGFYSAFMVADRVDVISRRAGADTAARWSSDGQGTYTIEPADVADAPARGTRVTLHLKDDAGDYTEGFKVERTIKAQSGHVPVAITLRDKPDADAKQIADGAALWTRAKADIGEDEYKDFYRTVAGQFDEPALTLHYRAEGRHEYSVLAFIPETKPFDLFDPDRNGRVKLYVRRVFITDEAEILPRYLRFVRGLVDSSDLPLNVSREMIQQSPVLAAIQKGVANRILSELEKLAENEPDRFTAIWENFGAVIKEGLYEDYSRREQLLNLSRFKTTAGDGWRSLKNYVGAFKDNQTAIYYATGTDLDRLAASPQLEGFRARGIEVLLLPDGVDSFWVTAGMDYEGKPFKSVTQGLADLSLIPLAEGETPASEAPAEVVDFIAAIKAALGEEVEDVRASERLTDSAVCLVAPEHGMDRQMEKLMAQGGRGGPAAKPVLEINPRHALIARLSGLGDSDAELRDDAARLLFDEARIADGELPTDPRAFAERLARVMGRAIG